MPNLLRGTAEKVARRASYALGAAAGALILKSLSDGHSARASKLHQQEIADEYSRLRESDTSQPESEDDSKNPDLTAWEAELAEHSSSGKD